MNINIEAIKKSRWPIEKASEWLDKCAEVRGCNYLSMNCVNPTAFWQDFDEEIINKELKWAEKIGLNSLRVFIQYIAYEERPGKLVDNINKFLDIAGKYNISVMPVFFDDCHGPEPSPGAQPSPIPGVHNSQWTASPGMSRTEKKYWGTLEKYITAIVRKFAEDERIIAWDLYNEAREEHRSLVEASFAWARSVDPSQPLAACWRTKELQDIITFHCYSDCDTEDFKNTVDNALKEERPVLCTECMARTLGNTLDKFLPIFAEKKIGWYVWGLVSGASQTRFPWGWPEGGPEPRVWFHDLLYPDGRPYDEKEIALIKKYAGIK